MSRAARGMALAYLAAMLLFAALFHPMEEVSSAERDGYVGYAQQLRDGQLPRDPYRPLLYPILAAGASLLTGDVFTGARTVSVLAAVLFCICAYWMGRLVLRSEAAGLVAMAGMMLNHNVVRHGVHASTDMTFSALAAGTVVVSIIMLDTTSRRWLVAAGLLWALAYFTRYTAVALFPVVLVAILLRRRATLRSVGGALIVFATVAALCLIPHFIMTERAFGAPLHNENWRNLALKLYGDWDWEYLEANPFDGLLSVVLHSPAVWLKASARELAVFGGRTLINLGGYGATGLVFAVASMAGGVLILRRIDRRSSLLLVSVASFVLVVCTFFYTSPRFMLAILPMLYVLCARALLSAPLRAPVEVMGLHMFRGTALLVAFLGPGLWALARELPVFVSLHPVAETQAAVALEVSHGHDIAVLGSSPFLWRRVEYDYRRVRITGEDDGYYGALNRMMTARRADYLIVGRLTAGRGTPTELLEGHPPEFLVVEEVSPDFAVYRFVGTD